MNCLATVRRIAGFLGIDVEDEHWPAILDHCSFDHMKRHADKVAPLGRVIFEGGADSFIHRGTNGRWRDVLTADDVTAYEKMALERLGPECAAWLAGTPGES